jgi:hypothetical protein
MTMLSNLLPLDNLKSQWQGLDQIHGFTFKPDLQAYLESPILVSLLDEHKFKNKAQIELFLNPPAFILDLFKALFIGSLFIRLGEYEMFVLSHRKSKHHRNTKYILLFPQINQHPFRIEPKSFFRRFWHHLFGNHFAFDHPMLEDALRFKRDRKIHDELKIVGQDFWGDLLTNASKLDKMAQIYQSMTNHISSLNRGSSTSAIDFRINEESFCITIDQAVPTADDLLLWKQFYSDQVIPFLKHTSNSFAP